VPSMKPVVVHAESDRPAEGGPSREVDGHARNLMLTCMETLQCDKYERIYPTAVALWRGLAGVVRKQSHLNKIESSANLVNLKQAPRESIADLIDRALLYRQRLQDVGVNKDDDELLLYIMDGLLPSFHFMAKMIKHGGIDGMGHSLEAATDMLVSEEKMLSKIGSSVSFVAPGDNRTSEMCSSTTAQWSARCSSEQRTRTTTDSRFSATAPPSSSPLCAE
jgi:hypothetical protein